MARRRARSSSRRRRSGKRGKGFPWLLAGAAAVGAYFLFGRDAKAAPDPQPGPTPTPGPGPGPVPPGGFPAGKYQVTTHDTGPAGDLMLRSTPDSSRSDNILEHLPHGSFVQASGVTNSGFAAVMAPDQKTGWASMAFLTLSP